MVVFRLNTTLSALVERRTNRFIDEVCIMVRAPGSDVAFLWYDESHSPEVKDGMSFVMSYLRANDIGSFTVIADPCETAEELLEIGNKQYNEFLKASGVKS